MRLVSEKKQAGEDKLVNNRICSVVGLSRPLTVLLALLLVPTLVFANYPDAARTLLQDNQGDAQLTLSESDTGAAHLTVKGPINENDLKVMTLANPERLVLDIKHLKVDNGKTLVVQDSNLVKQMRFGNHMDTGRIVLDLSSSVDYRVIAEGDALTVSFSNRAGTDPASNIVPVADRDNARSNDSLPKAVTQNEDSFARSVDAVIKAQPQMAANENTGADAKPLQVAAEQADQGKEDQVKEVELVTASNTKKTLAQLTDVSLQTKGGKDNYIVARMDSPGIYTFEKTAPSEYVLTLEDADIAENVQPALIAGAGSGAIRSVRAIKQGNLVKLRIFADPLAELEAKTDKGAIVVSVRKDSLVNSDRVMAQAELGELLEDEEPAAKNGKETNGTNGDGEQPSGETDLSGLLGSDTTYTGRLISLDLQDTEIDNALRIIAEVSNLNIIASDNVTGKVTLRLIDVPWDQALDVILKTNGLDKVQEGNVVRIAPVEKLRAEREALRQAQQAEDELEPLRVQYMRISYAKAAELQALVETVLTERGAVSHDARTNQLIVKDISKGIRNAARLVQKLDLRTPQVLIETQIIEAQRSFVRDLGSELGFTFIRSPETGNALGYNFPNTVSIGGSAEDTRGESAVGVGPIASFFPSTSPSSAVSALFGSADGTKSLSMRISAAEAEGRVRVVSKPSVAVTNNSPAVIKSVEKLRIRLPSGGVSVATGQGAAAGAGGTVATETIEVGIVLNVTAQASPDYYVLLDINAKSSSLGTLSEAVDDVPPEIERSTTSTVLVSSGQTFAMGGIYRIAEDSSAVGVPFLKDIPVLGSFFRRTGVNDRDEELIFFITPRIIEGSFDDAAMKAAS